MLGQVSWKERYFFLEISNNQNSIKVDFLKFNENLSDTMINQ